MSMELSKFLQRDIFETDTTVAGTRDGFGEGLKEAGAQSGQVVALCADLTESTRMHHFATAYPERFVEMGIAEQNMASVASGMAALGKVPFIASYAMFSPGRNWEQIRTTIAYNESNVKIVGAHAGVSVGPDGATHQAIEDLALMRVVPGMAVIAPVDFNEAKKATVWAAGYKGPVYIRLAREKTPVVTTTDAPFEFGKALLLVSAAAAAPKKVGIISTGTITAEAVRAAQLLNEAGVGASVLHMATVKPLDASALSEYAESHDVLMTVEEHQVAGGLGGAVAEYISAHRPMMVRRLGVNDQFGQSGTPEELIREYGLDANSICEVAKTLASNL